jgi:hypothetical protein
MADSHMFCIVIVTALVLGLSPSLSRSNKRACCLYFAGLIALFLLISSPFIYACSFAIKLKIALTAIHVVRFMFGLYRRRAVSLISHDSPTSVRHHDHFHCAKTER